MCNPRLINLKKLEPTAKKWRSVERKPIFCLMVLAILCTPISTSNDAQPNSVAIWNENGVSLYNQGKYNEALQAFNNALEFDSRSPEIWFNKGNAFYSQGKYEEALRAYDRVVELDPKYTHAWLAKGKALYYQRKYDEAILACDKVIELNPQDTDAWSIKNDALNALGRTAEAYQSVSQPHEGEPVKIPTYRPTFIPSRNSISTGPNQLGGFKGPEPIQLSRQTNI